jgi:hypothetical protein
VVVGGVARGRVSMRSPGEYKNGVFR